MFMTLHKRKLQVHTWTRACERCASKMHLSLAQSSSTFQSELSHYMIKNGVPKVVL